MYPKMLTASSRPQMPCTRAGMQGAVQHSYEEFPRLTETRLARNNLNYLKLSLITL